MTRQKLELTWIGKDQRPRLEPRILLEDPARSHHAATRMTDNDLFGNLLIKGDNLLALKALEAEFSGKVKCVFIDPPYNTGSAFTHYDDGLEHSIWLGLMRDRLEIIRRLLADDGSLWITIDDNEAHYLKVMCDEVFGRANFVANVIWQKKYAPANDAIWLSDSHDHVLVYARSKSTWRPNKLSRTEDQDKLYKNDDTDLRGPWMSDNYTCAKSADERPNLFYAVVNPNTGQEIWPKRTRVWAFERAAHERHIAENMIYWGKNGTNSTPRLKKFKENLRSSGRVPATIWLHEEVGHNQDAKREQLALNANVPFTTPKPEKLMLRVLEISTNPGDLVLDSFAGSGTTGAVAHKMGRRWIMVELGEHCHTHIVPRRSESDFIYVTTQTLSAEQLAALSEDVGAERSLLVCCAAYRGVTAVQAAERWPNLTIKKIPKMVKDRCEWGHDDYSLNVANLPMAQKPAAEVAAQDDLFGGDGA